MLKKFVATAAVALFALTSTGLAASAAPITPVRPAASAGVTATPLSAAEAEGLQFMVEEEKLAHDVYVALHEEWGLRVFDNIAAAEQQHTNAVSYVLDRYGVSNPTEGNVAGEFENSELQVLYTELVEQGIASIEGALEVGAAIEEIDILDLREALSNTTHADIEQVYQNLLAGSENHLRAFVSNLKVQSGEEYVPQYMSQEAYDALLGGTNQNGVGRRGGRVGRP